MKAISIGKIPLDFSKWMRRGALRSAWDSGKNTNERWDIIREIYKEHLPDIFSAARSNRLMSPYLVDWDFTPIEFDAWQDIRRWGLPFFPQFPVGKYFLDLADPYKKIGIELDGRAYHKEERDRHRDAELWEMGWRIFRAPGSQCKKSPWQPFEGDFTDQIREGWEDALGRLNDWACDYSEGLIWSIGVFYYPLRMPFGPEYMGAAQWSLESHRYEQFPLTDDPLEVAYGPG